MNDYKELIAELKELSDEEKEFASNSGDIYRAEMLALAADAIERLVKERDAEPVVHGHWIKNKDRAGWNCSNCHKDDCYAYLYNYDMDVECIQDYYCPNCGAKMDEEV